MKIRTRVAGVLLASTCLLPACSPPVTAPSVSSSAPLFATEVGEPSAAYETAQKYDLGVGTPRNIAAARKYYEVAVAEGDSRAMTDLAVLILKEGRLDERNRAFELLARAANQGSAAARFNLGISYLYGYGVRQNEARGIDLVSTASNQGNLRAQSFLVYWLRQSGLSPETSPELRQRVQSLVEAGQEDLWVEASQGSENDDLWQHFFMLPVGDRASGISDLLVLESLCTHCRTGISHKQIAQSMSQIEHLRDTATEDPGSAYELGLAYLAGNGVPLNEEEGARFVVKAADAGFVPAQYTLGKLYLDGHGIQSNRMMAYAWFSIAASDDLGFIDSRWARATLPSLEADMPKADIAKAQAWAANWSPNSEWYLRP